MREEIIKEFKGVWRGVVLGWALGLVVLLWIVMVIFDFVGSIFTDLSDYMRDLSDTIIDKATRSNGRTVPNTPPRN